MNNLMIDQFSPAIKKIYADRGFTPLHIAIMCGSIDDVRKILATQDIGQMIEQPANNGMRPLFMAVDCENLEMVELLIEAGADVNAVNHIISTKPTATEQTTTEPTTTTTATEQTATEPTTTTTATEQPIES